MRKYILDYLIRKESPLMRHDFSYFMGVQEEITMQEKIVRFSYLYSVKMEQERVFPSLMKTISYCISFFSSYTPT